MQKSKQEVIIVVSLVKNGGNLPFVSCPLSLIQCIVTELKYLASSMPL